MTGARTAVVIGAGGAGLAASRAMQQAGFDVLALEQSAQLGGVWATTLYPSLTIHSRSFNYRFHDYPAVSSSGPSATREEILGYLHAYARAMRIDDKIRYDTRVERIDYQPSRESERCTVVTSRGEHRCDVVVCASGFANAGHPHVPALPGRASSTVKVVHSSELSSAMVDDIVQHKRKVVVLGAGKSAHEILWLLRDSDATWIYAKSLWAFSYETLYESRWNVALYGYYLGIAALRRRFGYGRAMHALQAPLRWSKMFVNPLEPDSDVCRNRAAIMKREQLAFLQTVRSMKATITTMAPDGVVLDNGERLDADYLICATGYDRGRSVPALFVDGQPRPLIDQHGFYRDMIPPETPEVSLLAANVLYPQQLLGFSLGAQWLARFHAGTLRTQISRAEMRVSTGAEAKQFAPWSSGEYLSGGLPYAHQRKEHVLPQLFADMGLPATLARTLVLSGANEQKFGRTCDEIARQLTAGVQVRA
ncbi:MAG TPA: NAD(P)-binding domain-containing protein [Kofleriaceae bacterium]|jgi:cation diffusion facilitator CzcD-associated flavoprotein CzcO